MDSRNDHRTATARARNTISGVLLGIGAAAFFDEAVFHQILHWHHFYDKSTTEVGLVSDGLFHAVSWFATVAALFLFADIRRGNDFRRVRWWSGILLGGGVFQLYDGLVQHKLMGLHQIRYGVEIWPYDLIWNAIAILMIIAGVILYRRDASTSPAA